MYDYWLGGKDNFAADRKAAREALAAYPGMAHLARANRAFLGRVVRYLAGEAGVRQFLDIGTGIPSRAPPMRSHKRWRLSAGWSMWTMTRWCFPTRVPC